METLSVSRHVHMVPRDADTAVYHKLFGNLALLDDSGLKLLQRFEDGCAPEEVARNAQETQLIAEFKERFFLVPTGVDERMHVEEDKQYRSEHLESGYLLKGIQLVLTNDCNLGCTYCFQETIVQAEPTEASAEAPRIGEKRVKLPVIGQSAPAPTSQSASGGTSCGSKAARPSSSPDRFPMADENVKKMSPETAIETVREAVAAVRRAGNSLLSVEFFGGEPLVNWPAIEAVLDTFGNKSSADDGSHPVRLFYSMTTNATLVTEAIAEKLSRHKVTCTVSFDSPKNVNRLTKRGTSADQLILTGLERLSRHRNVMTFNTVVSIGNVDDVDVEGLLQTARHHQVRAIGLILDLDVKPYEDREAMRKVVDTVLDICAQAKNDGIAITGYWHQVFEQIVGTQLINLQKGYKTCAAEGCKLSFEPNGNVTHCKTTEKTIGHASQLGEVFKSPWYRTTAMKAYETTPYCRGCMIEGFCSGLCMGTLQKTYNDLDAIALPACEVYRELTEKLIRALPDHDSSLFLTASAEP